MLTSTSQLSIAMAPIDWGISIAAIVMLIFAARTFVSGKGRSQMGASFAFVAATVWTLALGRHVDGFSWVDGFRIGIGVLLLVPVFRVLFSHTGGSATGAVVSILLASVIAGPVLGRYFDEVTTERSPELERMKLDVKALDTQLEELTSTRDTVANFAATERAKLDEFGLSTADEIEGNPAAMATLEKYAKYKTELNRLTQQIADVRDDKVNMEATVAAIEQGGRASGAGMSEAERFRAKVERDAERTKSIQEKYTERSEMRDLFEKEFGRASKPD